jgi:hypothetical protein
MQLLLLDLQACLAFGSQSFLLPLYGWMRRAAGGGRWKIEHSQNIVGSRDSRCEWVVFTVCAVTANFRCSGKWRGVWRARCRKQTRGSEMEGVETLDRATPGTPSTSRRVAKSWAMSRQVT